MIYINFVLNNKELFTVKKKLKDSSRILERGAF